MLINGKKYRITVGAIAPILYNLNYGRSAIKDFTFNLEYNFENSVKLLYCAIRGKKPPYKDFLQACINDRKFIPKSMYKIREIFRTRPHKQKTQNDDSDDEASIDELEILGIFCNMNFPSCLLYECSLYQLMEIMGIASKMRNPDYISKKKMSNNQVKNFYHITPEQERAIAAALHKGE
jgi:hypothetical protein